MQIILAISPKKEVLFVNMFNLYGLWFVFLNV